MDRAMGRKKRSGEGLGKGEGQDKKIRLGFKYHKKGIASTLFLVFSLTELVIHSYFYELTPVNCIKIYLLGSLLLRFI